MAKGSNKILVIIPTYNEASNIAALLTAIWQNVEFVDILIIDDNSQDGTAAEVRKQQPASSGKLHLMLREGKLGLGTAYVAGFQWALQRGYDGVIQMDADFSHDPGMLPELIRNLQSYPVVVGSRYVQGGGTTNWNWLRRWISKFGSFYARSILGLTLRDLTGGFNGWQRQVLEAMKVETLKSEGYAFQIELKYRATQLGFPVKEIPIIFNERRAGKSKMSTVIILEALIKVLWMRKA